MGLAMCGLLIWGMVLSLECALLGLGSELPPRPHAAREPEDAGAAADLGLDRGAQRA